jgi:hypothetical protein
LEEKEVKNNIKNSGKPQPNGKVLRCINIDCVFNSSNQHGAIRNTCNHPNVVVESRFADITIAICSEFRSKKDYAFEKPATLIDLKSKEKTEILGTPNVEATTIEKVTTKDLEEGVSYTKHEETTPSEDTSNKTEDTPVKPVVIESGEVKQEELSPSEIYNLTDKPGNNLLILRRLYQPYTRAGLAGSIVFHLFIILLMWQFLVPKEETTDDTTNNQRIVVVEDLEMPKFDPPDLDKLKEEEEKLKEDEVKDNTSNVRPKINTKRITPNIKRPNTNNETDTNKSALNDTNKPKLDTNLTKSSRDTSRILVPDSLKASFDQNEIGLKLWFPKGWKLMDNRQVNLNQKEFNGVIIATDTLSEDPGAVNMFVIIDDPQHSKYNKATYKNPFPMDDSLTAAYVTDPQKGSGKRMTTKYFLFTDPTGMKNIEVNVEFANPAMLEKYQKLVDAVVRSIKIAEPPKKPDP